MVIKRGRLRGCGEEKREILEEEVFYGGRKGKRSKEEREGEDRSKAKGRSGGSVKREEGNLDQRGHWKKKKEGVIGKEGEGFSRIKIIKASWTRVLFDDD